MNEEYSVGYDAGYQEGWNAAMDSIPSQPKREWVGLTYDERVSIIAADENCSSRELCERIEKKLKEKNTIIKTYPKKDKT